MKRETNISFLSRAAATLVLMMLTTATAWADTETVSYIDADGYVQTQDIDISNRFSSTDWLSSLYTGWYYLNGDTRNGGTITIDGHVNLILKVGILTATNITIPTDCSLTIYRTADSRASSTINLETGSGNGIDVVGSLTIYGGNVRVNGGGGINIDSDGHFTVNGGSVTANSGGGIAGDFTVNGGFVRASSCSGNLTLNGGTLTVDGICYGNITLAGGTVTASDYTSYGCDLTIEDGWTYTDGTDTFDEGDIDEPVNNTTYQPEWTGSGTTADDPILIKTTADLDLLAQRVNAGTAYNDTYFQLANDIEYIPYLLDLANDNTYVENHTAIGGPSTPFCGTFDGANHAIIGVRIKKDGQTDADSHQGLFGYVGTGGTVKNVILKYAYIAGYQNVGGIVGENAGGMVENCHVLDDSRINAITSDAHCHGGIAGCNHSGTVTRCSSIAWNADINHNPQNCGDIVGSNGGTVSDCIALGGGIIGSSNVGAIVGYNTGSVTDSYFTATLAVGRDNLGGSLTGDDRAVGYNDGGTVTDCGIAPKDTQDNSHFLTLMAQRTYALTVAERPWPFDTGMNISLNGRTFYKDGKWNTLCLPFNYSAELIALKSDFAGATLMELDTEGTNGFDPTDGTLYLTFKGATEIRAGVPYLVKWDDDGTEFASPWFEPVTIGADFDAAATPTVTCSSDGLEQVQMVGCYSPVTFSTEDKSVLFMGGNNNLYYPDGTESITIGAFRAYFELDGITASPDPSQGGGSGVKAFVLNFGEEDADGILPPSISPEGERTEASPRGGLVGAAYYDLFGRRYESLPSGRTGGGRIYIHNGHKIVVK